LKELVQEQANNEIQTILRLADKNVREHRQQDDEHRERLQQRPEESADASVITSFEIRADERPREARQMRVALPDANGGNRSHRREP
jgi:hypothetical protein